MTMKHDNLIGTSYKPVLRTGSITYSIKKFFKRKDVKTTEHCDSSLNMYELI